MILNACAWMWETYPFEIGEIACHRTTISFGPSMSELFAPLLKCIPICILSDALIEDISLMVRFLADNQVTRIFVVPSLLRAFLDIMSLSKESLPRSDYGVPQAKLSLKNSLNVFMNFCHMQL